MDVPNPSGPMMDAIARRSAADLDTERGSMAMVQSRPMDRPRVKRDVEEAGDARCGFMDCTRSMWSDLIRREV